MVLASVSGNRGQFEEASRSLFHDSVKPTEMLRRLEVMGHLEIDWEGTGRWWVTPTVFNLIAGSGGNAVVTGSRTRGTISVLQAMLGDGELSSLHIVERSPEWPTSWFVGISSVRAATHGAERLGGTATNEAPYDYLSFLPDLESLVRASSTDFPPSGIQAEALTFGPILRFTATDISYGQFPPGCFRQLSRGIYRYLFVDDDQTLHAMTRWLAVHAELDRRRRAGLDAPTPVAWGPRTGRLTVTCNAQLPTAWARAVVLSSGLPPIRRWSEDRALVDVYDGVGANTFRRIVDSLRIPHRATEV